MPSSPERPPKACPSSSPPAFVLGGVLFAVALLVARFFPTWLGVLSLVGPLLVLASSAGGLLTAALPLLPLGAAVVLLAARAAQRPNGAGARGHPTPYDVTATPPP